MRKPILLWYFLICLIFSQLYAVNPAIVGRITDTQTGSALIGANIQLANTSLGTASKENGEFELTNIPPGQYTLKVSFIGYQSVEIQIEVVSGRRIVQDIQLNPATLTGKQIEVLATADVNRAQARETPIAFTQVDKIELAEKYTMNDLPDLLQEVPGVWTSSAGLGEAEIMLRGFSSENVRFLVNGVLMNDPENQNVYWSNWTGLAPLTQTIQVQRGSGFGLTGSGAFGGSVYIETMSVAPQKEISVRFSTGQFHTQGRTMSLSRGEKKVADGTGRFDPDYSPLQYTYALRYNSGPILDKKFNMSAYVEYKTGNSYIYGTDFDGYNVGLEAQAQLNRHQLNFSFFGAPQIHHQATALQDIDLLPTLGREYNRIHHEWQQNYFFKPVWVIRHEWNISPKSSLMNHFYFSLGRGADQNLVNGLFNVETGEYGYLPVSKVTDMNALGRHAEYLYYNFGLTSTTFYPGSVDNPPIFMGNDFKSKPLNLFTEQFEHSWQNQRRRDHWQVGFSSYFQTKLGKYVELVLGRETRLWKGHRVSNARILRCNEPVVNGNVAIISQLQPVYDYDTQVAHFSGVGRFTFMPWESFTIQTGGALTQIFMKVIENPIKMFDFGSGGYFEKPIRTTADQLEDIEMHPLIYPEFYITGRPKFSEGDYLRDYSFFTPWIGTNYNLTQHLNLFANYALTKKEPAILDWYDFTIGPRIPENGFPMLKPENGENYELGLGFQSMPINVRLNYYHTLHKDKIEAVEDFNDRRFALNAGQALFQGVEIEAQTQLGPLQIKSSAAIAKNRWQKMNVRELFGNSADQVVHKVVPFSPERTFSAAIQLPVDAWRFGLTLNYWDDYYGTYTNVYPRTDGSLASAKLPHFFDLSARLSYATHFQVLDIIFRVQLNNLLNRADNYLRAQYSIDYLRNDALAGKYHWYVLQAPLFNFFLTMEVGFR